MKLNDFFSLKLLLLISVLFLLTSCAAGNPQFTPENPSGFWYGLWHGIISFISLIIHIFNENVLVYEVNNTGGWYDFGFLIGVICIWGSGTHISKKSCKKKKRSKEWDEIGEKVEKKVMRKLKEWAEDEDSTDSSKDWKDIGEKVEKKLKRKIREWAEED